MEINKEKKVLTENDYEKAASTALSYAIAGWLLGYFIIGVILEGYVFHYTEIAKKSSNPRVIKKAKIAWWIACVFWCLLPALGVLYVPLLFTIIKDTFLSIILWLITVSIITSLIIWFKKRESWNKWSKKKKHIILSGLLIYSIYGLIIIFYTKFH